MSLNKSARRRVWLLASSSLVAAGLTAAISLTPTTAAAQAVCAPAPSSGGGTSSVSYSGALYAAGIDCDANGNMTVSVTTNSADIGGPGIVLTGTGADSVTFNGPNAASNQEIDGVGLTGALINIATNSGAITVNAGALDADQSAATGMTHGILATSTSGIIDINLIGTLDAEASNTNLGGIAGIHARTGGAGSIDVSATNVSGRLYGLWAETTGSGDILVTSGSFTSQSSTGQAGIFADAQGGGDIDIRAGSASGRLYGVLAETTGAGNLSIALTSIANAQTGGVAAVDATTGSGDFSFTGGAGSDGADFTAVRGVLGGDALLNLNSIGGLGVGSWLIDLDMEAGSTATINANGEFNNTSHDNYDRKAIRVRGGADVLVSIGNQFFGALDLSDTAQADVSVVAGGEWRPAGTTLFGAGGSSLTILEDGNLLPMSVTALGAHVVEESDVTILDFTASSGDRVLNEGEITLGTAPEILPGSLNLGPGYEIDLRFEGLETFDNASVIRFGVVTDRYGNAKPERAVKADGHADDRLHMSGTTFNGLSGSTLILDVNLNGAQEACDTALRDPVTFNMPAADCVRIEDGATSGVTHIVVQQTVIGDRGGAGGIVLVDVSGGTSAAEHFVLDPASPGYSAVNGGVIDKGFFIFPLVYDASTQQHKLVATAGQSAHQFPIAAQAAHGLWRLSTGSWLDRQADLRGGIEEGIGGGVWMRVGTESADRDAIQTADVAGNPFTYDNTHTQSSYTVTGGVDLLAGDAGGGAYVFGLTAGYIHADLAYEASPNEQRLDGWSGGGYASFVSGGLFVDVAVNANRLELEAEVPGLNLRPAGAMLATNLTSVGAQVEAGWRLPFGAGVFVEPLAGVSYVQSKYDDMNIAADDPLRPGVIVEFDDPTSLRAGAGARVGLDQDYGPVRAQYSLLGRVWNEFEGETRLIAHNTGADAFVLDEFTGQFTEVGLGASVYGMDGIVSGFLNLGGKFGDDYQAASASAGVRVAW